MHSVRNKKVEKMFFKLHKKLGRPLLDFERDNAQLDLSMIETLYKQIEKENAELKALVDLRLSVERSCIGVKAKLYDDLKRQSEAKVAFNVGDTISMNIQSFMGVEIPTYAKITNVMYNVRAEFNDNQFSEMCLTEEELKERLIKNEQFN